MKAGAVNELHGCCPFLHVLFILTLIFSELGHHRATLGALEVVPHHPLAMPKALNKGALVQISSDQLQLPLAIAAAIASLASEPRPVAVAV